MTPKEKAKELVDKFKDYVHGYVGSSMLTNTEYPEQILSQAKKCALIVVNEIIEAIEVFGYTSTWYDHQETSQMTLTEDIPVEKYWQEVKQELEKL